MHIFTFCVSTLINYFLNIIKIKYFTRSDLIFLIYILLGVLLILNTRIDGLETLFTTLKLIKNNYTEYLFIISILFIYFIYLRKQKSIMLNIFEQNFYRRRAL